MKRINTLFAILGTAVAAAMVAANVSIADHHSTAAQDADTTRDRTLTLNVYALDICPVSGMKLGSMGDPVVKEYRTKYGMREVRFCCDGCVEPFNKELEENMKKIDEKLIEQQKAHYPLKECIVSGRSLEESDTVLDIIYQGRLVRFCCPNCPPRFNADPARYLVRLDEAVIKQQREKYPLTTCIISGMELGSMGEPYERIVGGSLVRFCCEACVKEFKKDPHKHLAAIREAWVKQHESQSEGHE